MAKKRKPALGGGARCYRPPRREGPHIRSKKLSCRRCCLLAAVRGDGSDSLGFVDPFFADPSAADCKPQSGSSGLDAGTSASTPFPSYDILCALRVVGAAPDLGAYESP